MLHVCLQVEKLIDDGYDVRGYYYWTLVDNFEVRPCMLYKGQMAHGLPLCISTQTFPVCETLTHLNHNHSASNSMFLQL